MTGATRVGADRFIRVVLALSVGAACLFPSAANADSILVWSVNFEQKSCEITAEGAKEIADFAEFSNSNGTTRVSLVARAADEGSEHEMARLSQCRGDAVKAALIRGGLVHAIIDLEVMGDPDTWRRRQRDWSAEHDRSVIMVQTEWR